MVVFSGISLTHFCFFRRILGAIPIGLDDIMHCRIKKLDMKKAVITTQKNVISYKETNTKIRNRNEVQAIVLHQRFLSAFYYQKEVNLMKTTNNKKNSITIRLNNNELGIVNINSQNLNLSRAY